MISEIEKNLSLQKETLEAQKQRQEQFLKWKRNAVDVDFVKH